MRKWLCSLIQWRKIHLELCVLLSSSTHSSPLLLFFDLIFLSAHNRKYDYSFLSALFLSSSNRSTCPGSPKRIQQRIPAQMDANLACIRFVCVCVSVSLKGQKTPGHGMGERSAIPKMVIESNAVVGAVGLCTLHGCRCSEILLICA